MAKTTVSSIRTKSTRRIDYDITDDDLDNLFVDILNDKLKEINQMFFDYNIMQEITAIGSFQLRAGQEFRDITKALIVGDKSTFTGTANDKIKVSIDGTDTDDIDISGDASISDVVASINTAVGSTVAFVDDNTRLMIVSLVTGSTSTVTIADGTTTGQTVVAELFSVALDRTASAITDLNEIIKLSDRVNDVAFYNILPWSLFRERNPDPTAASQTSPNDVARFNDRIYFGETPSSAIRVYIDYIKSLTEVVLLDTLPFDNKYDPLIIAMCKAELLDTLEIASTDKIVLAQRNEQRLKGSLIINATKNLGMVQQSASRRGSRRFLRPNPQVPDSTG